MKKAAYVLGAFLSVLSVSILFAGGEEESMESLKAFDPEVNYTVRIGLFPDLDQAYEAIVSSAEFKAKFPNITVEFDSTEWAGHHERLVTVIAAGEPTNDIEAIDEAYLKTFEDGGFTDLAPTPFNGRKAGKDLVQYSMTNATIPDGSIIGLPVDVAPAILFYRKSAADKAGVDMDAIPDWEAFLEIARKLTIDKDGDGKADQYALSNAVDISLIPLNNGRGAWVDENGEVMEPKEKFIRLLQTVKRIDDYGIHANLTEWTDPWIAAFPKGLVVFAPYGAWFEGALSTWMAPDLKGDWRAARLPDDTFCNYGGSYLGIPEKMPLEKKLAAWEVLKYLCTTEHAQRSTLVKIGAFPALTTVFNDPVMDEPIEYLGGQKARKIYADIAKRIPVVESHAVDEAAKGIWQNVITEIVEGTVTVEEAYEKAKTSIQALIE